MERKCGVCDAASQLGKCAAPYTSDRFNPGFIALTESASTPRLRATFAIYVALVAATAVVGPARWIAVLVLPVAACSASFAWRSPAWAASGPRCSSRATRTWNWSPPDPMPVAAIRSTPARCWARSGSGSPRARCCCARCVVVLIAALVIYAAACEEQFLADAFPEEFPAYVAATPNKWWPDAAAHAPCRNTLTCARRCSGRPSSTPASFFLLYLLVLTCRGVPSASRCSEPASAARYFAGALTQLVFARSPATSNSRSYLPSMHCVLRPCAAHPGSPSRGNARAPC